MLIILVCFCTNDTAAAKATFKFLEHHHCLISIFSLFFNLLSLNCYCCCNLSPVFPASSRWKSFLSTPSRWQGPLCSHTNKQFRSSYLFTPVMISPVLCFRVIIYFFICIKYVRCSHLQAGQMLCSLCSPGSKQWYSTAQPSMWQLLHFVWNRGDRQSATKPTSKSHSLCLLVICLDRHHVSSASTPVLPPCDAGIRDIPLLLHPCIDLVLSQSRTKSSFIMTDNKELFFYRQKDIITGQICMRTVCF